MRARARLKPWHVIAVAVACLAVGGTAYGVITNPSGVQINQIQMKTNTDSFSTNLQAFTFVPGSSVTMTVEAGTQAVLRGRFSAESRCINHEVGGVDAICTAAIFVNGVPMNPNSGTDFAFDSGGPCCNNDPDGEEAHSMERVSNTLNPGTYTVNVRTRTNSADGEFIVDDWMLSVERIPKVPAGPS